jgi:hypothetical protein
MKLKTVVVALAVAQAAALAPFTMGAAHAATLTLKGGRPVNASPLDLAAKGYVEQEFFMSGAANAYDKDGTWRKDGVWQVKVAKTDQPYKTRFLVRYPSDPAKFNGTVVVEWLNVTGFTDIEIDGVYMAEELLAKGYAWVGVSAQKAGLDGIKKINAERYGELVISNDAMSYDIFSEVARTLRSDYATVLGGLKPAKLLAAGQSQSGLRLATYVNAFHTREKQFDAYLIHSRGSFPAGLSGLLSGPLVAFIRTDLDVPVFQLETEFDTGPALFGQARQPDTPKLRSWEVAGAAHIDDYAMTQLNAATASAMGMAPISCVKPFNNLPFYRVEKAVLRHMQAWMTEGKAPPSAPTIATNTNGTFQRDSVGNALGGVRLPEIEAPTNNYTLSNGPKSGQASGGILGLMACTFLGGSTPLTDAQLKSLYSSRDDYMSRYSAAAQAAVAAGYLLPEDAATGLAEAQARAQAMPLP